MLIHPQTCDRGENSMMIGCNQHLNDHRRDRCFMG